MQNRTDGDVCLGHVTCSDSQRLQGLIVNNSGCRLYIAVVRALVHMLALFLTDTISLGYFQLFPLQTKKQNLRET